MLEGRSKAAQDGRNPVQAVIGQNRPFERWLIPSAARSGCRRLQGRSVLFSFSVQLASASRAGREWLNFYLTTKALVRLDMSEYMEKHRWPDDRCATGYVGYEEGGQLTKPKTAALFFVFAGRMEKLSVVSITVSDSG
jgi:hypothetical protein